MKRAKQYSPKKSGAKKKFNLNQTSHQQGFDKDWTSFRFRYLHYNQNCYACGVHKDVIRIDIDHIITRKYRPEHAKNVTNMMPLCVSCHSTVTQLFDRKLPPDTEGKMKWVDKKRKLTGTDIKIKVIPYIKR